MPVKTAVRPLTIEKTLDDVEEWLNRISAIRKKMHRARLGSEFYIDHLPALTVELNWLKEKSQSALNVIEEFLDSLPEDE